MPAIASGSPPKSFWIIAAAALLWNLMGVVTYLMTVSMSPEALAAMSEAERTLYTDVPVLVTSAYAIAVFGGTLASLALLLRRAWAIPLFAVSLLAILIQMGHALFFSSLLEVKGAGAAVLPLLIIVVAMALLWYAHLAKTRGWLS